MDSGNRLAAGSSDSAAQLDSVVATVHSPVPRAHAAFPELFGMMLSLCAIVYRACSMLGRQAAAALAAAHAVSVVHRDLWHGGSAGSGTGSATGASERASLSAREVENGTIVRSGRRERPRADHTDLTTLDHPLCGRALDPVNDPCAQVGRVPALVIRSELRALVRRSVRSVRVVIPRRRDESPATSGRGSARAFRSDLDGGTSLPPTSGRVSARASRSDLDGGTSLPPTSGRVSARSSRSAA